MSASQANGGQLIVEIAGNVVATVTLNLPVLTIGRTPDNGLSLPHPNTSRRHAEIRLTPAGPIFTDLGSSNGTTVDGARLLPQQPLLLRDGLAIQIGPFTLTYRAPEVVSPRAEPPAASLVEERSAAPEPPPPAPIAPIPPALPLARRGASGASLPTHGPYSRYLRDLPVIFEPTEGNDFLGRFLLIFESIWEPLEQRQDHLALYLDPRTAPTAFLPWLAGWLSVAVDTRWPEERLRGLVAEAMDLYRWRGTAYGLTRMIEISTGLTPRIDENPSNPFVFAVVVAEPPGSRVDRDLLHAVIVAHKPAHAGYTLEVVR